MPATEAEILANVNAKIAGLPFRFTEEMVKTPKGEKKVSFFVADTICVDKKKNMALSFRADDLAVDLTEVHNAARILNEETKQHELTGGREARVVLNQPGKENLKRLFDNIEPLRLDNGDDESTANLILRVLPELVTFVTDHYEMDEDTSEAVWQERTIFRAIAHCTESATEFKVPTFMDWKACKGYLPAFKLAYTFEANKTNPKIGIWKRNKTEKAARFQVVEEKAS